MTTNKLTLRAQSNLVKECEQETGNVIILIVYLPSSCTNQKPKAVHINLLPGFHPLFYCLFCFVSWARLQVTDVAHVALHLLFLAAQQIPEKEL